MVVAGGRGTGKSVLARASALLPAIEILEGSWNEEPDGKPSKVIPAPFVQIPLGVTEDRWWAQSMSPARYQGRTVFARAPRRSPPRFSTSMSSTCRDANALNLVLAAVGQAPTRWSAKAQRGPPCRPLLIATYNPEEAVRDHLASCREPADKASTARLASLKLPSPMAKTPASEPIQEETDALATQPLLARQWLPDVQISREQIAYW